MPLRYWVQKKVFYMKKRKNDPFLQNKQARRAKNFILRMSFMLSVVGLAFIHSRRNSCEEQQMQICTFKNRIVSVLQFVKGFLIVIMSVTGQRSCAHSQWSKCRHPATQFDKKCSSPILSSKFSTHSTFGFPSYPMTFQQ